MLEKLGEFSDTNTELLGEFIVTTSTEVKT